MTLIHLSLSTCDYDLYVCFSWRYNLL